MLQAGPVERVDVMKDKGFAFCKFTTVVSFHTQQFLQVIFAASLFSSMEGSFYGTFLLKNTPLPGFQAGMLWSATGGCSVCASYAG